MIPAVIQRVLLACGAIAGIVVLAIWLHSAHLESQARAFKPSPAHPVTQAQIDRALSQFEGARKNNPDTRPDVEEATILTFLGRDAEGHGDAAERGARRAAQRDRLGTALGGYAELGSGAVGSGCGSLSDAGSALASLTRADRSAWAISAPARITAISDSAGISQSQSSPACTSQTLSAAIQPAVSAASRR